jgi:hypothetical protein
MSELLSPNLSPETLLNANRTPEAKKRRREWYLARDNDDLWVIWGCADARHTFTHEKSIFIRTIANGGTKDNYSGIITDKRIRGILMVGHFAGDHDFAHTPGGCGGREAKASIGMPAEQVYGITHFIGRHVDHHDVVIQTLLAAEKAAILTDKPVLAVAQNHHNGTFYPLGSFANRGRNMTKSVPTSQFMDHGYDPNLLYSNGLPVISGDEIPEVFDDILDLNSKYLDMVYQRSPDFQTTQQVQNPASIGIGTVIKPLRVRYSEIFDLPNSAFHLSVPRLNLDTEPQTLEPLQLVIDQVEYPVTHKLKNRGQRNQSFADTNHLLIETHSLDLSRSVAEAYLQREWARQWHLLPETQIITAEVIHGNVTRIEAFSK